MIAKFPAFSKLTLDLKDDVEAVTSHFEPYSDFNFSSLYCWDTDDYTSVSDLNGNLVIRLPDYLSGGPITSMLGDKKIDESIEQLLANTKALNLVPEVVVKALEKRRFNLLADKDSFDYIYDLEQHANLTGPDFKGKRKKVNRFIRNFQNRYIVRPIDFEDHRTKDLILNVFDDWAKAKNKQGKDTHQRRVATTRMIENAQVLGIIGLIIYLDDKPAGFTIYETADNKWATWHSHKILPQYENLDAFATMEASKDLLRRGQTYINWEQDFGTPSIRQLKLTYHPVKYLKKYTIISVE
ncbi:DUF2156 domain-containing protein [Candidatus Saccharibacteria bacterium]|nr:DUF2156 domain-containing protein [Candidatus Saccharibacteria bacterium]